MKKLIPLALLLAGCITSNQIPQCTLEQQVVMLNKQFPQAFLFQGYKCGDKEIVKRYDLTDYESYDGFLLMYFGTEEVKDTQVKEK